jgi:hypothetical protein
VTNANATRLVPQTATPPIPLRERMACLHKQVEYMAARMTTIRETVAGSTPVDQSAADALPTSEGAINVLDDMMCGLLRKLERMDSEIEVLMQQLPRL